MPKFTFLKPIDQPQGNLRLLKELEACLLNPELKSFKVIVAFVKSGPLLRLKQHIQDWRQRTTLLKLL